MSTSSQPVTVHIPIACNLTGDEQVERRAALAGVFSGVEQVRELEDGYAFRFPGTDAWAIELFSFIMAERVCCPFFRFELSFEADQGPLWLFLRGGEGVKEFVQVQMQDEVRAATQGSQSCSCCA
ncbi:MAG: hypothetical protein M3220_08590 [Chloroflexota bacterium]|nr:hypothetical protein [Chloroflexota bacterium]